MKTYFWNGRHIEMWDFVYDAMLSCGEGLL